MPLLPPKYDTLLIDYKVVIKKNKLRMAILFSFLPVTAVITLLLYKFTLGYISNGLWIVALLQFVFFGIAIWLVKRSPVLLEIDTQKKTITVKNEKAYNQADALVLNISEMKGTSGYTYDYLQLALKNGDPVKLLRIENSIFSRDKEGEQLAAFIAEATGLQLIRESKR
ncbi:MAG TPA: hypothetical protein VK174_02660 [Chitinophagales bacterium]|nr:hypothetical protein [Chitinophagales bacterium]